MVTLFIILIIIAAILFFVLNGISAKRLNEVNSLEAKKRSLESKFDFMIEQRKELRKEIEDKERELANIKNGQEGIKTFSAHDLDLSDENDDDKVSRYLIQEGKISLEQHEKVLKKMTILKMDYIGVSLTLGYIDLKTAQKAMKINKITSKTLSMNS